MDYRNNVVFLEILVWFLAGVVLAKNCSSEKSGFTAKILNKHDDGKGLPVNITFYPGHSVTISPWITYEGCYRVTSYTFFRTINLTNNNAERCHEHCHKEDRFALENITCYCLKTNAAISQVQEAKCNISCKNSTVYEPCGGSNYISVYRRLIFRHDFSLPGEDCVTMQCENNNSLTPNITLRTVPCNANRTSICRGGTKANPVPHFISKKMDWSDSHRECMQGYDKQGLLFSFEQGSNPCTKYTQILSENWINIFRSSIKQSVLGSSENKVDNSYITHCYNLTLVPSSQTKPTEIILNVSSKGTEQVTPGFQATYMYSNLSRTTEKAVYTEQHGIPLVNDKLTTRSNGKTLMDTTVEIRPSIERSTKKKNIIMHSFTANIKSYVTPALYKNTISGVVRVKSTSTSHTSVRNNHNATMKKTGAFGTPAIAGIAVACLLVAVLVTVLIICKWKKSKHRSSGDKYNSSTRCNPGYTMHESEKICMDDISLTERTRQSSDYVSPTGHHSTKVSNEHKLQSKQHDTNYTHPEYANADTRRRDIQRGVRDETDVYDSLGHDKMKEVPENDYYDHTGTFSGHASGSELYDRLGGASVKMDDVNDCYSHTQNLMKRTSESEVYDRLGNSKLTVDDTDDFYSHTRDFNNKVHESELYDRLGTGKVKIEVEDDFYDHTCTNSAQGQYDHLSYN